MQMHLQILPHKIPSYLLMLQRHHIPWNPQTLPILPLHLHIPWQPMQIFPQHPHIPWHASLATISVEVIPPEVQNWPVDVPWLAMPAVEAEEEVEVLVATKVEVEEEVEVEALVATKVEKRVEV